MSIWHLSKNIWVMHKILKYRKNLSEFLMYIEPWNYKSFFLSIEMITCLTHIYAICIFYIYMYMYMCTTYIYIYLNFLDIMQISLCEEKISKSWTEWSYYTSRIWNHLTWTDVEYLSYILWCNRRMEAKASKAKL